MSRSHRNPTINFHIANWEREEIEAKIIASGLSKRDYFVRSCIYNRVCVVGKKELIYKLVQELQTMQMVIKEVAEQMGMTPSAITQRYNRMMHDVVIPYFKRYFVASEYESSVYATMDAKNCMPCMAKMSIDADFAEPSEYNNMDNMSGYKT